MGRQQVIVGIGEVLETRLPDREGPGGIAAEVAINAIRLGQRGLIISRVGQDPTGDSVLAALRGAGAITEHIQTDPDLATGRLVVRSIGGRVSRSLDDRAAFDNLQWDFDLEDVSQEAEAVVFGALARRYGQTRTTIDRFLSASSHALRIFDLTNRAGDDLNRSDLTQGLEIAEALVLDAASIASIAPGQSGEPIAVIATGLMRQHRLTFLVTIDDDEGGLVVHTPEDAHAARVPVADATRTAAIVGLVHGLLSGWDWTRSLRAAVVCGHHALDDAAGAIPPEMLDAS